MQKIYNFFYIFNSFDQNKKEEVLIDFQALIEFDELLNDLPSFEPSNEVLEKVLKFV